MSDFDIHNCNTQGYPKVKSIAYNKMFNISEIMILLFRTRYQVFCFLDIKDVPFLQKYSKLKIVKLEEFKRYHFCFHFED